MMHQFVVTNENPECWEGEVGLETLSKNDFLLFPNPAKDQLFMQAHSESKSTVRIISLNGQIVREETFDAFDGTVPIDIRGLKHGFYIVEWSSATSRVSKKLLLD